MESVLDEFSSFSRSFDTLTCTLCEWPSFYGHLKKCTKKWRVFIAQLPSVLVIVHHSFLCFFFVSPFPTVAESIQKELDEYRASEEEVKRLKNVMVGFKVCNASK